MRLLAAVHKLIDIRNPIHKDMKIQEDYVDKFNEEAKRVWVDNDKGQQYQQEERKNDLQNPQDDDEEDEVDFHSHVSELSQP